MRARADRLGAIFSCASGAGRGTTVEVSIDRDALAAIAATASTSMPSAAEDASIRDG
jgi:hypothetical protein